MFKRSLCLVLLAACGFPAPSDTSPDAAGSNVPDAVVSPGAALYAVRPAIARAGDTVTLEGTFDGDTTVTFPGAGPVHATVLGTHRATAVVPADATGGEVTLAGAGAPFHRASYTLGVRSFQRFDNQANGARQMPTLATARFTQASIAIGRFVYVVGGSGNGNLLASVERARIQADGSLGAFETVSGVALSQPRAEGTLVRAGNFVYIMGGFVNGAVSATVERAAIAADGSLGTFETLDSQLVQAMTGMRAAVIGDQLYVVGGRTTSDDLASNGALATVQRATIALDGTLGAFAEAPGVALQTARENHELVVAGHSLLAIAGVGVAGRNAPLASIEIADIHADGTLGAFAPGGSLQMARGGHRAAVVGSQLVVEGGETGSLMASVEVASLDGDGVPGTFAAAGQLPEGRAFSTLEVVGDQLYVIGGGASSGVTASVFRASLNASGKLATTGTSHPYVNQRFSEPAAIVGDSMYLLGADGQPTDTVERGALDGTGTLGAFATASYGDGGCQTRQASATIGKFVYVLGGAPCQNAALATVLRAPIRDDGSLGAFVAQPGNLTTERASAASVVLGNKLYVIGGWYTSETSIESAPIHADGTLGTFTAESAALTTPRMDSNAIVLGKFLYLIGGATTSEGGGITSIERIPIGDDGSLVGSFAVVGQLTQPRMFSGTAVVGGFLYVFGGAVYGTPDTVERAPIDANGNLGTFQKVSGMASPGVFPVTVAGNHANVCGNEGCTQLNLE